MSISVSAFFVLQNPSSYNPIDFDRNMHAGDIDVERVETDKKLRLNLLFPYKNV